MQAPRAPERANAVRNSFPRPRAEPVTTQVLFSRENEGSVRKVRVVLKLARLCRPSERESTGRKDEPSSILTDL